ncbi:hypothetical protein BVV10_22640 [Xanthomonas oryzae pv. oryzae]|nr:hypothetical protein BVV16_22635 [Xanthomonas oryzae pv. oryzae]AUI95910.1 hypothetical protein BVV17_22675 [Xanthomonas oryzae pv. oryzae]AUI99583.1 hypothetical protein BVV18_22675 [Xanthomonas oryzae pv. oryzae]AUJ03259.1 hypothetical protein BVV10_22640 [Xanthomonas oryzae pv. oryzae]AUJ06924.1 hypothetical protein BVV19_22715 [Xanthomonas oryzae pv. oryzae]
MAIAWRLGFRKVATDAGSGTRRCLHGAAQVIAPLINAVSRRRIQLSPAHGACKGKTTPPSVNA